MYHVFFFNDTATTEIYTLSLHDALPIFVLRVKEHEPSRPKTSDEARTEITAILKREKAAAAVEEAAEKIMAELSNGRSEEHTSELQSRQYLVCRLLLEKKKINKT